MEGSGPGDAVWQRGGVILTANKQGKTGVIVGAGASGIAAAISLANDQDYRVLLLEKKPEIGGTVTHSLIHTLGGLYDTRGQIINQGLPQDLVQRLKAEDSKTVQRRIGKAWVLAVDPAVYQKVIQEWLEEYTNIDIFTSISGLSVNKDTKDTAVDSISFLKDGAIVEVETDVVVDASGCADLVRLIDDNLVIDDKPAMAAIVFQLCGVPHSSIKAPRNIALMRKIRAAVKDGRLPAQLASTWLDIGIHANEIYVKASIPVPDGWRCDDGEIFMETTGRRAINQLLNFLKKDADMTDVCVGKIGALGIRDGGRVRGCYQLTGDDLRARRKFSDAACRCSWPIEYWNPEKGVTLEYIPEGEYYDIPISALQVYGISNVWGIGKCMSADHLAQASARVVGACWAMGDAAGRYITGREL